MNFSNNEIKRMIYMAAVIIFVIIAGVIYIAKNDTRNNTSDYDTEVVFEEKASSSPDDNITDSDVICIYISGAVKHPGVYELKSNSRVNDAVSAAGGFKKKADRDSLNLAAYINDGEHIHISFKEKIKSDDESSSLVNINKASKEELMTLPGIGESKADSIIKYRDENNGFNSIEELMNISGIKEGVYSKISEYITI